MNRPEALVQLERLRFLQLHAMVLAGSEMDRLDLHRNVLAIEMAVQDLQAFLNDSTQTRHCGFKEINPPVEATPEEIAHAVPPLRETDKRNRLSEVEDVADRRWIEEGTVRSRDGRPVRDQAQHALRLRRGPQLSLF
jgi:hypothetical protein